MKKTKNQILLAALGKGHREAYLAANPHGFAKTTTSTTNKKKYSRKRKNDY